MAFTVSDFHDLVRLLEERPEWRAELRRLLIPQELLELPALVRELIEAQRRTEERVTALVEAQRRTEERVNALVEAQQHTEERVNALVEAQQRTEALLQALIQRMDRMEDRQERTEQWQERTEARLDRMGQSQGRMEERQDGMEQRLDRIETGLGDVRGQLLETRYRDRAGAHFGPIVRRVRVVTDRELDDLLDQDEGPGMLPEETLRDLRLADLVVRGRRPGEEHDTYLVIEVSAAIDPHDVERAVRRAAAMNRLRPALAVVAGQRITAEAQALAAKRRVVQVIDGQIAGVPAT